MTQEYSEHSALLNQGRYAPLNTGGAAPYGSGANGNYQDREIDFFGLLKVLFRRKFLILAFLILGGLGGLLYGLQQVPLFKSSVSLEVQKQETQIVNGSGVDPVVTADSEFMATQYTLLRSRSLVERVVLLLGLESKKGFSNPGSNREDRIRQATNVVLANLKVAPVARSRVINVTYIHPSANTAASVSNAIAESYIESTLERKFNTTAYARKFLQERLKQAKLALESSERDLVRYAEDNDILELDKSGNQSSLLASNLVRLTEEYAEAKSERIKLEQAFLAAQNGVVDVPIVESANLVNMRSNLFDLNVKYQELLGTFKPAHPDMIKLAARIEAIDKEVAKEIGQKKQAITQASSGGYQSALAREKTIQASIEASKVELRGLRKRSIDYTIIRRELDTARSQYDALLQRLKEVSINSGVGSSQISIVDRAIAPKSPFSPNIKILLVLGTLLGLGCGLGLAFLLHFLDDTIKTPDDIKAKLKIPTIGIIPMIKGRKGHDNIIITDLADPRSNISEAYFSARTALEFATEQGTPKSLLLTSTQPAEGKTSTSLALAVSFAKIGRKVLIVDADLRKPSFVADKDKSIGLSGLLTTPSKVEENVIYSKQYKLHLLPSGPTPPNPAELLSGPRLKAIVAEAEGLFDIVIVDSPPMLSFTDSSVLGAACKAVMVVYKSGNIRTAAAQKTVERLIDNRVNVVGAILTHFEAKKMGYDNNYYYYAYGDGASEYGKDRKTSAESAQRKIHLFKDETEVS